MSNICKFCNGSKTKKLFAGGFIHFEILTESDEEIIFCIDCGKIGVLK